MKTVEIDNCELTYASVISDPVTMTRKRMSDEVHYPAAEPEDNERNKLPRFEYVTQINGHSGSASYHLPHLINYCETVDFHNEKGQRIFLTDSENAEFVNIMLQENLLSVQAPMNGNGVVSCEAHGTATSTELIELNSAELLDLDGRTTNCETVGEESSIVTFVNNPGNENDFEKQLVRVEIQDETPISRQVNNIGGQTLNICHQPQQHNNARRAHQGNGKLTQQPLIDWVNIIINQSSFPCTEDLEDKNLSWLFNFKLDELPHLSPEVSHRSTAGNGQPGRSTSSSSPSTTATTTSAKDRRNSEQSSPDRCSIPEKVLKKPPFTYTELIEYALEDQSELTVSGIYQWIS